ncbi:MAG: hypothetical protein ACQEQO_11325 [Thermodesulfobacteriota bacterium]
MGYNFMVKALKNNWTNKARIIPLILALLFIIICIPRTSPSQVFQDTKAITNEFIQIKEKLHCNSHALTDVVRSIDAIGKSPANKKDSLWLSFVGRTVEYVRDVIDDSIDTLDILSSELLTDYNLSAYTAFFIRDSGIKKDAILSKIELIESFHGEIKDVVVMDLIDRAKDTMNRSQKLFDISVKRLLLLKAAQ